MDITPASRAGQPVTVYYPSASRIFENDTGPASAACQLQAAVSSSASTTTKESLGKSVCCTTMQLWWHANFALFEKFIHAHHWKVLSSFLLLGLFCLGLKLVSVDTNFDRLWVEESDRLISEWRYLANAMQRAGQQGLYPENPYYSGYDVRRSRFGMMPVVRLRSNPGLDDLDASSASSNSFMPQSRSRSGTFQPGLPGHEFMVTMETILQTVVNTEDHPRFGDRSSQQIPPRLLTPSALLDHMEFLIKVRRLQVTVGASKWSFEDLCQRATLPFGAGMHHIQAYLDMIIPCSIITPLDCFWEGAKVLGPEEGKWVPWPHKFGEQTLFQWTHIDPIGLLENLRERYQNYSGAELGNLINLFHTAGINHGYLNKSCLDPSDPACPVSAPNYRGQAPNVARVLTGGCPGFAGNMLHWPEEIILGGRVHQVANATESASIHPMSNFSSDKLLLSASALQSLILLRSPRDLYEAVRLNDPYKYEGWTLADAQHVLDEWRRSFRRLVLEHNLGLQQNTEWQYYAFTDNSLRDLLRDLTLRLGPIKVVGCVLLVLMYGLVCLLDWRDPVRSQCWFALSGLIMTTVACLAGLGICAALGLPFNVLTIQVLPFILLGLSMDGIFMLTTCYQCCITRRTTAPSSISSTKDNSPLTTWASTTSISTCSSSSTYSTSSTGLLSHSALVLSEHGPSLLFGTIAMSGAFFSAAYIPIPLMRQFCLQAGTLVLVQSVSIFLLFPCLLKLDGIRRAQRRLDVLCCLQQPKVTATPSSHQVPCSSASEYTAVRRDQASRRQPACFSHSREHQARVLTSTTTASTCRGCSTAKRSHGRTKDVATHRSCPSIQVNVVNHLSQVGSATAACTSCTNPSQSVGNPPTGPQHTVHTTVTVTSPTREAVSPTELISHPQSLNGTDFVSSEPYHHLQCAPEKSVKNLYYSHRRTPNLYSNSPIQTDPLSDRTRAPFLVRLARRLALFLTCHWVVQSLVCLAGIGLFIAAGLMGNYCLELGLDLSSLTPTDAVEYGFVRHSDRAFGLYNFQVFARGTDLPGSRLPPPRMGLRGTVSRNKDGLKLSDPPTSVVVDTQPRARTSRATIGRGIDFPIQQRQLLHLYSRISQLPGVMMPGHRFWLEAMRTWLEEVQAAFDMDRERGVISENGHWNSNASELGVLGLRLIIQTDRGPELRRIKTGRLVHGGIIDPPAFYVLLGAWRTYDALNFSSPGWMIHPEPNLIQIARHRAIGRPHDLHAIPPAEPIEFVQTNFYAVGLSGMRLQLQLVQNVRLLTESATAQGVPTFPTGTPFTFTEHYLYLARESAIALGIFFGIIFAASLLLFSSPVIVILLVLVGGGGGVCAAICGLVLLGLELNPISAGLILFSAGLGARTAVGFLGSWSKAHGSSSPSTRLPTHTPREKRGLCICRPQCNHKADCSANEAQYCRSTRSWKSVAVSLDTGFDVPIELSDKRKASSTHSGRTSSSPPSVRSSDRGIISGSSARSHLVHSLSNQFASTLHSIVGLILAVALLAASRVKFIADYFFSLIAVVSAICLFNTICLIPTLCYLLHSLQQYFVPVGIVQQSIDRRTASARGSHRKRQPRFHSTGPIPEGTRESPPNTTNVSASLPVSSSTSTFHGTHSVESSSHSTQESASEQQEAVQNISTPATPALKTPKSTRIPPVPPRTSPMQLLAEYTNNQLYDLCSRHLRELANVKSRKINASRLDDSTTRSDAAAAAAAVVMAAAAAASVRSRPASLSTISEEPSHASSIVSLNHITSSNSSGDHGSSDSASRTEKNAHPPSSTTLESGDINAVDLLNLSKLLTTGSSAINLYRQFSVFSPRFQRNDSKALGLTQVSLHHSNPDLNCELMAVVTTAEPRVSRNDRSTPSPPPSYSYAVGEGGPSTEPRPLSIPPSSADSLSHGQHMIHNPSVTREASDSARDSLLPPLYAHSWHPISRNSAHHSHEHSPAAQHSLRGNRHRLPVSSISRTPGSRRTPTNYANSHRPDETRQ